MWSFVNGDGAGGGAQGREIPTCHPNSFFSSIDIKMSH